MDKLFQDRTVFCLVRHGETDWNLSGRLQGREDLPLNETGRNQARLTGAYLSKWPWDLIVTSPLSRALETARLVGDKTAAKILEPETDLQERDYGESAGLTREESDGRWTDGAVPGLESNADLRERGFSVLVSLAARFPQTRMVVVSHGSLINSLLSVVSKGEIGTGKTRLSSACLSLVSFDPPKWRIEDYNNVAHLTEPSG